MPKIRVPTARRAGRVDRDPRIGQKSGQKEIPPDYDAFPELRRAKLLTLVQERRKLAAEMAERKARIEVIGDLVHSALISAGIEESESVMAGDCRVTFARGKSVHLSAEKLLKNGVSANVIARSKVVKEYTYARFTEKKSGGSEDSEEYVEDDL